MWSAILSPDFFATILRTATPILFATLAAGIAAKSGITNMALEGIMLFSALFGVFFSSMTQSAFLGLLITVAIGACIGLFLAFFVLNLKTDEILAAIAINLAATGGTVLLLVAFSGDRGVSSSIRSVSAPNITIPFVEKIPFVGQILSGQNILSWLALLAVVVMHLFLYKTPLGLSIRSVGECSGSLRRLLSVRRIYEYVYKGYVRRARIYRTGGIQHGRKYTGGRSSGIPSVRYGSGSCQYHAAEGSHALRVDSDGTVSGYSDRSWGILLRTEKEERAPQREIKKDCRRVQNDLSGFAAVFIKNLWIEIRHREAELRLSLPLLQPHGLLFGWLL